VLWCPTLLSPICQLYRGVSFISGVQGENHRPTANSWYTLSHNVVSSTSSLNGIRTHKVSSFRY
jgi:hypothetical protein